MPRKSTILKVCQKCGIEKSLSDYHRNMTKSDGHNGICKDCQKEVNKGNK
jgi:superfamily II helicase